MPGLDFHGEQRRGYPQGSLAVHVLGFTDIDGNGIAGIEKSFDEQLRDPARTGDTLQLSLDIRVQHIVRDELARAVETFQADGAGALGLDNHNDEVSRSVGRGVGKGGVRKSEYRCVLLHKQINTKTLNIVI